MAKIVLHTNDMRRMVLVAMLCQFYNTTEEIVIGEIIKIAQEDNDENK